MTYRLPLVLALLAPSAFAEETRQLDSHEHGVGELNIAFDGNTVAMELRAPGADIVGFEYEAKSTEDRAAIDAAVASLARPLELFLAPAAAECSVKQASATLESEDEHNDHDEHEDEHGHDENHTEADEHGDEHDEDHAEADEHEHEHDGGHAEADEHDEDHAKASHTEFHAEYALTCGNPDALSEITFAYFDTFESARELEVKVVTASGAQSFEVERDNPKLDLRGMF